jgi:hypothetical protein
VKIVKKEGPFHFLVGTISNVLVIEIGWTDVGSRGDILVSCAHSNTSYLFRFYVDTGLHHNTGTGVIAVQLNVGDTLYVKAYVDNMHIYYPYSCITIIKIY